MWGFKIRIKNGEHSIYIYEESIATDDGSRWMHWKATGKYKFEVELLFKISVPPDPEIEKLSTAFLKSELIDISEYFPGFIGKIQLRSHHLFVKTDNRDVPICFEKYMANGIGELKLHGGY